jgi:hypothetical protein
MKNTYRSSAGREIAATFTALVVTSIGYLNYNPKSIPQGQTLPALVRQYEEPKALIGYDRWDDVRESFDPQNRVPRPSRAVLETELDSAKKKNNLARINSIMGALELTDLCEKNKIPYALASLARGSGYQGMLQRDSFPTVLVYCLPTVDIDNAKEVERNHEYAWSHQAGKERDVRSFVIHHNIALFLDFNPKDALVKMLRGGEK